MQPRNLPQPDNLIRSFTAKAEQLGFDALGISDIQLSQAESRLLEWLNKGYHGSMDYMQRHGEKRSQPDKLIPGSLSVISVRMNYLSEDQGTAIDLLNCADKAYISRYALGRDYHKLMRHRLAKLVKHIEKEIGPFGYRVFTDSAPVLEKPIAAKAGLGWVGKHSNILCKEEGSWFFLGEIYVDLALPQNKPEKDHCGDCTNCIDVCPTGAIVEPYVVDARRCISYLTIENRGSIPEALRPLMGNRIYGCDDCQLFCPWNRFAKKAIESDFEARHGVDDISLIELFSWSEAQFLTRFEGSPIRRIGYSSWLRNIAVALGNAKFSSDIVEALELKKCYPSELVREHVIWAIAEQARKKLA